MQAHEAFKELESGKGRPFYLVLGDEPFQAGEIVSRLKAFFTKGDDRDVFHFESWDGESLDMGALRASLDQLPGLFDEPGAVRLVVCYRFDRIAPSLLDSLEPYFQNPSPTTCFLILAAKADRRKGWLKQIEEKGAVIEVSEPSDREWPRWLTYFEKKVGKKISPEAWERIIENAGRSLAIVWEELKKLAAYVGERTEITPADATAFTTAWGGGDVFEFVDDVMADRRYEALRRFHDLLRGGEAEIKLLSLLVRQLRLVGQYSRLTASGSSSRELPQQLGVPPFLIAKLRAQATRHSLAELDWALGLAAECDFRLKTGEGTLFEHFLVPYFAGRCGARAGSDNRRTSPSL